MDKSPNEDRALIEKGDVHRLFTDLSGDPLMWKFVADRLITGARILVAEATGPRAHAGGGDQMIPVRLREMPEWVLVAFQTITAEMLYGMAIEALIKGVYVTKFAGHQTKPGKKGGYQFYTLAQALRGPDHHAVGAVRRLAW